MRVHDMHMHPNQTEPNADLCEPEGTPLELAAANDAAKLAGGAHVDGAGSGSGSSSSEQVFQVKPLETLHEQTSSEVALPPHSRVEYFFASDARYQCITASLSKSCCPLPARTSLPLPVQLEFRAYIPLYRLFTLTESSVHYD